MVLSVAVAALWRDGALVLHGSLILFGTLDAHWLAYFVWCSLRR